MKREVLLPVFPLRIVSLVPSQTELLYDLGLGDRVVGITKFCIHPESWFENKPRVGGTKNVNFEKIKELQPDLIIGNKEENSKEDIETLEKDYPVWVSDVNSISEAMEMITQIGVITGVPEESLSIVKQIVKVKKEMKVLSLPKKVLYFIWNNPYMVVGKNTFIDDMLSEFGYENLITEERYVELSLEEIVAYNPEEILLSSEPFPFNENHVKELQKYLPNTEIKLVDGELFSWYGSRMVKAFGYL